jgi:hypothetical protein
MRRPADSPGWLTHHKASQETPVNALFLAFDLTLAILQMDFGDGDGARAVQNFRQLLLTIAQLVLQFLRGEILPGPLVIIGNSWIAEYPPSAGISSRAREVAKCELSNIIC